MGILNKIKDWLTGKPKTTKKKKDAYNISNYGGGASTNTVRAEIRRSVAKQKSQEDETREKVKAAFAATTPKAQKTVTEVAKTAREKKSSTPTVKSAFKATPPSTKRSTALGGLSESDIKSRTAKRVAAEANRKEKVRAADNLKALIDEKYGTRKSGVPTYVKQGNLAADPLVAKYNVLKHPVATSATRGAVSGTTFGLSELAIQKLPKSKEMEEAERFYQANKSKGAEFAGEMAGSLAGFGLTSGLSKEAVAKAAPKTTARLGEGATELLAKNKLVVNAARKEALRKLGAEATEEEIKRFARTRAAKIVQALGEDAAINLTTGLVSDATHALIDSDNPLEFAKNMAISAGMNIGLGGVTSAVPALRGRNDLAADALADRAAQRAARNLDDVRGVVEFPPRNADAIDVINPDLERLAPKVEAQPPQEPKVTLNRKRKTDLILNEKPKVEAKPQSVAEQYNLDDVIPFASVDEPMPSTNPQQTAINETLTTLENRTKEIGGVKPFTDDGIKVNKVAEDAAVSEGLPSGVKQVRSAYDYNNGEKIEDGILTSWNEAWQASKEYSASHARGEKSRQSKVAVSQLNAMDSDAERELRQRLADSGELNYDAIDTPELYDKIAKQMRDDPDRWVKDMIEINEGGALDFRSTPEWQARVQYIMGTIDPSADAASEIAYTEAFKLAQNISSKGGQTLNLRRNFVHLTPMGKRDAILDDLVNILDKSKGFQKNHPRMTSLGKFDRKNYIRSILMEDEAIKNGLEKLVKTDNLDDVSEAFTDLMLNVNRKNPKAGFDVLQEIRYLNMLGNPKTHIRNVFGSGFFAPIRQTSNMIRSAIEEPIEKWAKRYGKVEITKHGGFSPTAVMETWAKNPKTEAGKAAQEAFERLHNDLLGSAKYDTTMYKGRGTTIAGKTIDTLSDFNSSLLSKEDDFFKSRAFKENYIKSYNRYLKDGKPINDKIKRKIEAEAMQEAQIATFNEYNNFAKWLNNITRKASDANAGTVERWIGRGTNAIMPFTKVPANLMKQSINYSPLGIAKGMANIKTAAKSGDSAALNRAIDELSSGLTGSAIFGLGMLLGKTTHNMFGLETELTTNAGKNDPAAKFKKDRGMQNYSVSFKDPETGQGRSFTLDWLVPTSATFFSGVEMANQLNKGDFNILDIGGDWSDVITRLAEPVMETSMLSGLHGMLETMRNGSDDDDTKGAIGILLRETVQSYMNSMIPTLAGQISRTAYKTDMQVVGDDDWEYWRNQLKSKAGLANTSVLGEPLGADTDAYGNIKGEKKTAGDKAEAVLKNFISPANIQKVDFSEVDKEKLAEYERRVKAGEDPNDLAYLFPKKQYKKKFSVGDMDVKMSNKDLSTYNQAKTTGGKEGMRYVLENIMFNRYEEDASGNKVLKDGYTKSEKNKLLKEFDGKSLREVEEWLYEQPQFKNASDAEKRRAINGLWSLSGQGKSQGAKRVGEQAVIEAQGGDVNEYNFKNELSEKKREALQPYIDKGVVSYEEAVDFARNGGKTYYYENDEGGTASTYYNKKQMIEYLMDKGYSYEKAEALFNSFKTSRAKPYSGNSLSSGRGGYYRRGYRRWHRGGGGSSIPMPKLKQSAFKAKKAHVTGSVNTGVKIGSAVTGTKASITPKSVKTTKSGSKKLSAALEDIKQTEKKVTPPKARKSK